MTDKKEQFLDDMCGKIKYRRIHKHIRQEVSTHICETAEQYEKSGFSHELAVNMAVSHMGNAEHIGNEFNKQYRLPFNNRFGLGIWAIVVTMFIYLIYPLFYKLCNNTIQTGCNTITVIIGIAIFVVANYFLLRRRNLKMCVRDWIEISVGFLIGWALVITLLTLVSDGVYPYFKDVKVLFTYPYVPLLPKDLSVFGMEFFSWWCCLILYMLSTKGSSKRNSFIFLTRFPGANGYIETDEDFYM